MQTLSSLQDHTLHQQLKALVSQEREILTQVLRHLKEIERRKLFSDFGCSSLFDYAVRELSYSEGQAHRRIQAMRLLKELPELEAKLRTGELSLTNASKAQGFFKQIERSSEQETFTKQAKTQLLGKLENKSVREAERELIKINPQAALPKESERVVAADKTEVRFVIDDATKAKLETVRSLLGTKGVGLGYAELIQCMADVCIPSLEARRFSKKRTVQKKLKKEKTKHSAPKSPVNLRSDEPALAATKVDKCNKNRYIPTHMRHQVWERDGGRCCHCKSKRGLQYDHVEPVAKGGETSADNLRLLCFHCNQRAAMQVFGVGHMVKMQDPSTASQEDCS